MSRNCIIPPGSKIFNHLRVEASGPTWMVLRDPEGNLSFQEIGSWSAFRHAMGDTQPEPPRTLMVGDRIKGYFRDPPSSVLMTIQAVGVDYFVAMGDDTQYSEFWIVEDWSQFIMAVQLQRPVPQPFPGLRARERR